MPSPDAGPTPLGGLSNARLWYQTPDRMLEPNNTHCHTCLSYTDAPPLQGSPTMSHAPRNIVLVTIDSLRADHCGFLGDDRGLTPTLDELAAEGVAYQNAVSPGPQTFSTMPAVFSGHRRVGGDVQHAPGETHWRRRLAAIDAHLDRYGSIAEHFSEMGYTTAGISPNPWASSAAGFDRGFDVFSNMVGKASRGWVRSFVKGLPGIDSTQKSVQLILDLLGGRSFFASADQIHTELQSIREDLTEPYFLWVFLLDTHFPFLPPGSHREEQSYIGMLQSTIRSAPAMRGHSETMPETVRGSIQRSYRDTVRTVDHAIDKLRSELGGDRPVLLVHSDHGESFGEHGNYGHHHRELYQENVHVPYLVHDGRIEADVSEPVSLTTIPQLSHAVATGSEFDPTSITSPAAVSMSEGGLNRAARDREFKYIEHDTDRSLYTLLEGGELKDVAEHYPERCADLREYIDRADRHVSETETLAHAARRVARDPPKRQNPEAGSP